MLAVRAQRSPMRTVGNRAREAADTLGRSQRVTRVSPRDSAAASSRLASSPMEGCSARTPTRVCPEPGMWRGAASNVPLFEAEAAVRPSPTLALASRGGRRTFSLAGRGAIGPSPQPSPLQGEGAIGPHSNALHCWARGSSNPHPTPHQRERLIAKFTAWRLLGKRAHQVDCNGSLACTAWDSVRRSRASTSGSTPAQMATATSSAGADPSTICQRSGSDSAWSRYARRTRS